MNWHKNSGEQIIMKSATNSLFLILLLLILQGLVQSNVCASENCCAQNIPSMPQSIHTESPDVDGCSCCEHSAPTQEECPYSLSLDCCCEVSNWPTPVVPSTTKISIARGEFVLSDEHSFANLYSVDCSPVNLATTFISYRRPSELLYLNCVLRI